MKYTLKYRDEVPDDINAAIEYYSEVSEDLAVDFLKEVKVTLDNILSGPLHFQKIHRDTRKANLHRFPYTVLYIVNSDVIAITGIVHLHRHPNVWQTRK